MFYTVRNLNRPFSTWQRAETYLNVCGTIRQVTKIDLKSKVIEYKNAKRKCGWVTALKAASYILSIFILPLIAWAICRVHRSQYKFKLTKPAKPPAKVPIAVTPIPVAKASKSHMIFPEDILPEIANQTGKPWTIENTHRCDSSFYLGVDTIDLSNEHNITDADLERLTKKYPNIEHLYLGDCPKLTSKGFAHLKVWKNKLRTLSLDSTNCVGDAELALFKNSKNIQTLKLKWLKKVTDAGLAHFKKNQSIQSLHLSMLPKVTDAGLAHFKKNQSIQSLHLSMLPKVTDNGLAHFKHNQHIQSLHLSVLCSGMVDPSSRITDNGLAHFKKNQNIQSLHLSMLPKVTDNGLAHFKHNQHIQSLHLSGYLKVTDNGLALFKHNQHIQSLHLDALYSGVTDDGLAHFKNNQNIQTLHLGNLGLSGKVTNNGLAHFKHNQHIQTLELWNLQAVTNNGLAHFKNNQNIQSLICALDKVTIKTLEEFNTWIKTLPHEEM